MIAHRRFIVESVASEEGYDKLHKQSERKTCDLDHRQTNYEYQESID